MKKSDDKIITNKKGILISQKSGKDFGIDWQEISSIQVFKRDLFAVDEICMEIITSTGESFEINEEMTGWDELVKSIPSHLEHCIKFDEWYPIVAKPPFETSLTEIYNSKNYAV